jgi:uncharacterized protein
MTESPNLDTAQPRRLGWGRFVLQLLTVALAYIAGSVPAALLWGKGSPFAGAQESTLVALSPVGGALAGLLMAWFWLRRDGASVQAWTLSRPDSWRQTIGIALAAAVAIIVWFQVGGLVLKWLGFPSVATDDIIKLATANPASLALWIVAVAWVAAGFGEEVLYRGFLLDRLQRLPGIAGRLWLAVGIQALAFGLPHAYQGASGMILTTVVGLFFGWLRTKTAWNLWPLIIAHALVDTLMLSAAYLEKLGYWGA